MTGGSGQECPLQPAPVPVERSGGGFGTRGHPESAESLSGASSIPGLSARSGRFWCPDCRSRWSGYNVAHCASCHETFGGVSGFDAHRVGQWHAYDASKDTRRCAHPSEVGLVLTSRGTWGVDGGDVDFTEVFGRRAAGVSS